MEHLRPGTVLRVIKIGYVYFPCAPVRQFLLFSPLGDGKTQLEKD